MTEQEKRARFFKKTGRLATTATVEYQAFLWGIEFGVEAEREACARIAETPISGEQDDITMAAKDRVAKAIRMRSNAK
jgi:hypothetical protein